jgi:hypothetical protein
MLFNRDQKDVFEVNNWKYLMELDTCGDDIYICKLFEEELEKEKKLDDNYGKDETVPLVFYSDPDLGIVSRTPCFELVIPSQDMKACIEPGCLYRSLKLRKAKFVNGDGSDMDIFCTVGFDIRNPEYWYRLNKMLVLPDKSLFGYNYVLSIINPYGKALCFKPMIVKDHKDLCDAYTNSCNYLIDDIYSIKAERDSLYYELKVIENDHVTNNSKRIDKLLSMIYGMDKRLATVFNICQTTERKVKYL